MIENNLYKRIRIKSVSENVKGFKTFVLDDDQAIQYKPGQYLTLVSYDHDEEIRRSYSITSTPAINEPLSIGVKRVENGFFSRQLVDAAVEGDELITIGAGGLFTLPENINDFKQFFFFAAGSGITPVFSLIKTLLYAYHYVNVILVYSNASQEKTIFYNELEWLRKKFHRRFQVKFLFSNSVQLAAARLHRNMIIQMLHDLNTTSIADTLFYICGPDAYMRLCIYTLQENDVPQRNIRREDFAINAIRKRDAAPPDKNSRTVYFNLNGREYHFKVNFPDSILQSAKKAGIILPYSCEAGRCGSCAAKCLHGEVWHSYNEVLTEKELQQHIVLTCVGHPVNGDVTLQIPV
ncbi:MAG: iron-sulfur cluster-binding domain-containing protein [Bacteroidetes bacterium]|nr:iron-sulfur cluster-binding domain-containing protein [Bacteroidota bacterium]